MNDNRSGGEGLQRKLSPLNVWALALGSIIGWGAFVMPANTFLPNAGPLGTLIAMAAGAIIMVVIALNYSYMINHFPVAAQKSRVKAEKTKIFFQKASSGFGDVSFKERSGRFKA